MIRIALTGSIGMGKSTVAKMFAAAGIPVFDSDAEVRQLQGLHGALVDAIAKAFPAAVSDKQIDRETLAKIVLSDRAKLAELEALTHPAVQAARANFITRHSDAPALLFDIPLLFETKAEEQFDKVIVVSAPAAVQRERVLRRSGMTAAKLDSILARQMPDSDKRARADFIIDTSGEKSATEAQVRNILSCLGLVEGG